MNNTRRRFEILLPLQFNDGDDIPDDLIADAVSEVVGHFGAASYQNDVIEGHWTDSEVVYHDKLSKIVVDVLDTEENQRWMSDYKARWKEKLEQLDLWVVSFTVNIES